MTEAIAQQAETPSHDQGYYFSSNDVALFDVEPGCEPVSLVAIANGRALDVLHGLSLRMPIRQVLFLDINPAQVEHLRRIIALIAQSADRRDFLSRLLCLHAPAAAWEALDQASFDDTNSAGTPLDAALHGERERHFWSLACFDGTAFRDRYGLNASITADGLRIDAAVMGGFDRYLLTLLPLPDSHDTTGPAVFGLGYGQGFLGSEDSFTRMRTLLATLPLSFLCGDAATMLEPALMRWRYEPTVLWASNLFNPGFVRRHPPLGALWQRLVELGCGPLDLRIMMDQRGRRPLPPQVRSNRRPGWKRFTDHVLSFRAVARWLDGADGLHITARDETPSTLPGLRTVPLARFLAEGPPPSRVPAIFLHLLHGYGSPIDVFNRILPLAAAACDRLVVLEHHRQSPDFTDGTATLTPADIRAVLGPEIGSEAVIGGRGGLRNLVMAYGGARPAWAAGLPPEASVTRMPSSPALDDEPMDGEQRIHHLELRQHQVEQAGLAAMQAWLAQDPDAGEAAGDFYRGQVDKRSLFNRVHTAMARYLVETAGAGDMVVEVGSGLGPLCWLLAACGLRVTGYECNNRRHAAAQDLTGPALAAWPDAASRVRFISGLFPFAFDGGMLSGGGRRLLVCTDIVNGLTAQHADAILRMFFLFDRVIINLRTFGVLRDREGQQALLDRLRNAGFTLERTLLSDNAGLCIVLCPPSLTASDPS
ncbi:hypothetical protein [Niveispirillum sp. KHB5.9]|uniref:hypothetical protein n=1 Tax=Niveispirillum sp. KHB5.9 TaxID=3400269 RepID=UPI003A8696F7